MGKERIDGMPLTMTLKVMIKELRSGLESETRGQRNAGTPGQKEEKPMVSFEPSEEQAMVKETIAGFATDQMEPIGRAHV